MRREPHGRRNLAADPVHAETRAALDRELAGWLAVTPDPLFDGEIPAPPAPSRLLDAQPDLR